MIISASRRTDIPGCHGEWFADCLQQGYADVVNPRNRTQVRRVSLKRSDVDGIVFWTKYAGPFMQHLDALQEYPYYFLYTINRYRERVEPGIPEVNVVIEDFRALSRRLGPHRVIWRYDPVLISDEFTVSHHQEQFSRISGMLAGYTETCIISFIDIYRKIRKQCSRSGIRVPQEEEITRLAETVSSVGERSRIALQTCCEAVDLSRYGITRGGCIDAGLLAAISGERLSAGRDRNQRALCRCAGSIDIGSYRTCPHACIYCYAG